MSLAEMGAAPSRTKRKPKTIKLPGTVTLTASATKPAAAAKTQALTAAAAPVAVKPKTKIPQWVWLVAAALGIGAVFWFLRGGKARRRRRTNPLALT